jgi:hypothetical protein
MSAAPLARARLASHVPAHLALDGCYQLGDDRKAAEVGGLAALPHAEVQHSLLAAPDQEERQLLVPLVPGQHERDGAASALMLAGEPLAGEPSNGRGEREALGPDETRTRPGMARWRGPEVRQREAARHGFNEGTPAEPDPTRGGRPRQAYTA